MPPHTEPHRQTIVGLISDTHGLLRAEALQGLRGSDCIVHAGDIGRPEILRGLAEIAPVTAVRGNNDYGAWAQDIPDTAVLRIGEISVYVLHDIAQLDLDPAQRGFHVVIAGHSHRPLAERRNGVWFVNPGSAGPRRFRLPLSIGRMRVSGLRLDVALLTLQVQP